MTVTTIQGLWKEGSKKKQNLFWRCLQPQGWGRKAPRKKNYCEGACDHVALWNFRLRFEPSGLPPLNSQVYASKAGSIYLHNTRYIHTFQTHGPMLHPRCPRVWDQAYISCVCVVYNSKISTLCLCHWIQHFCTASQFCSLSGGNLIKHIF
jgi:hypothetical protein